MIVVFSNMVKMKKVKNYVWNMRPKTELLFLKANVTHEIKLV